MPPQEILYALSVNNMPFLEWPDCLTVIAVLNVSFWHNKMYMKYKHY